MLFSPLLSQYNFSLFLPRMNIFMQSSVHIGGDPFCLHNAMAPDYFPWPFLVCSSRLQLFIFFSFSELVCFPAGSLREHLILSVYLVNNSTDTGEEVGDCDFTLSEDVPFLQTVGIIKLHCYPDTLKWLFRLGEERKDNCWEKIIFFFLLQNITNFSSE